MSNQNEEERVRTVIQSMLREGGSPEPPLTPRALRQLAPRSRWPYFDPKVIVAATAAAILIGAMFTIGPLRPAKQTLQTPAVNTTTSQPATPSTTSPPTTVPPTTTVPAAVPSTTTAVPTTTTTSPGPTLATCVSAVINYGDTLSTQEPVGYGCQDQTVLSEALLHVRGHVVNSDVIIIVSAVCNNYPRAPLCL